MKYKVGDKVRIKSLDWYNENKDEYGYVRCIDFLFTPEHSKYCGSEFTVAHITEFRIPSYVMDNNGHEWTDEMIEGLVEEEKVSNVNSITHDRGDKLACKNDEELPSGNLYEWECPDGYIFKDDNGNVINAQKIVLEKKKKEYPKTFEECVHVLEGESRMSLEQMNTFRRLIDARNAYWKIAGDEMGLGKPWEPDWGNPDHASYPTITRGGGKIIRTTIYTHDCIFAFPTAEMRDAFKENFDPDIEICKEFL